MKESRISSLGTSSTPDGLITTGYHPRSAKMHPQIKIEPTCLVFPPPHHGRCIQNAISIYNVSKQPCVYKMRSQNPERYVVKPHVAVVAPESALRIFVTLRDMNTLGTKNLPEDTNDRFRISLRLYDPATVDTSLAPKELWNVLQQRGLKVDHEQDLVSYFTKMDTPVGGLVTFFPPTYIPVTPTPIGKVGEGASSAGANGTQTNASAGRGLTSDLNATASAQQRKTAPHPAVAAVGKRRPSGGAEAAAAKGNRMPAVWVGVAVAALVVVSLAVAVGVTLRGGVPASSSAAPAHGVPLQESPAWVQEEAAPLIRAAEKVERAARARREEETQTRLAAEAEQARLRREEEEWAGVQQQQQQQRQQQ